MNNFSDLTLCAVLRNNLQKNSFETPTPVQARAIPAALEGRDVVATAQTGTGKTLAFILPMIEALQKNKATRGVQALVLCPTRELAIQINEVFLRLAAGSGLRSSVVVGGMSETHQLRAIRQGASVVIATPGRLCDFMKRDLVRLGTVQLFVLDEADRMLDMGFLPSIQAIAKALPATKQTLFFSATIEKSVAHLVEAHVRNPVRISIGPMTTPTEHVELRLYEVEQDAKLHLLTRLLRQEAGSFLVFARTRHSTDRLAKNLSVAGVKTGRIHGDRTQSQRNQALQSFKEGEYRVLVATDVAARGIHVDGINHVVNYDLPQVPEDFIHRVGRTGRAGARGTASTFSTRSERGEIRKIEQTLRVRLTPHDTGEQSSANAVSPAAKVIPIRAQRFTSSRPSAGRRFTKRRA